MTGQSYRTVHSTAESHHETTITDYDHVTMTKWCDIWIEKCINSKSIFSIDVLKHQYTGYTWPSHNQYFDYDKVTQWCVNSEQWGFDKIIVNPTTKKYSQRWDGTKGLLLHSTFSTGINYYLFINL